MNKIFTVVHAEKESVRGLRKGKYERLPEDEYWVSVPPNTEGLLLFSAVTAKGHWLVQHNEWRRGENKGVITSEFKP